MYLNNRGGEACRNVGGGGGGGSSKGLSPTEQVSMAATAQI